MLVECNSRHCQEVDFSLLRRILNLMLHVCHMDAGVHFWSSSSLSSNLLLTEKFLMPSFISTSSVALFHFAASLSIPMFAFIPSLYKYASSRRASSGCSVSRNQKSFPYLQFCLLHYLTKVRLLFQDKITCKRHKFVCLFVFRFYVVMILMLSLIKISFKSLGVLKSDILLLTLS